jgi:hypothetical protein
LEDPKSKN